MTDRKCKTCGMQMMECLMYGYWFCCNSDCPQYHLEIKDKETRVMNNKEELDMLIALLKKMTPVVCKENAGITKYMDEKKQTETTVYLSIIVRTVNVKAIG